MKDWKIHKGVIATRLIHCCPNQIPGKFGGGHTCSRYANKWFCGLCRVYAPEEINFVAELARCRPLVFSRDPGPTGGSAGCQR